jgi:uncharacterized protein
VSCWWLTGHSDLGSVGSDLDEALGACQLARCVFTAHMTAAAARVSGAVLGVLVFLTVTSFMLAIGEGPASEAWAKAGGWTGLLTAAIAWYASSAGVTNVTFGRTVLPTAPR